eukprot:1157566-Pelagomonas_calceolata.AAC.2
MDSSTCGEDSSTASSWTAVQQAAQRADGQQPGKQLDDSMACRLTAVAASKATVSIKHFEPSNMLSVAYALFNTLKSSRALLNEYTPSML